MQPPTSKKTLIVQLSPALLDLPSTAAYVAMSETSVKRGIRENAFPKPRLLGPRRVGWLVRELDGWAETRPVADLLPPANTGRRKVKGEDSQI